MNVLIAIDKFKGSLSAVEAAHAIQAGLPSDSQADLCPIADGGEGFAETMMTALGGKWINVDVHDALGRPISARYALSPEGVAIMEMAAASGFELIAAEDRDILNSSTFGTGTLIRHAVEISHARKILIGIGGSATNDGGSGMAKALGVRFLDKNGENLASLPADLLNLEKIDSGARIALPPIEVACDVDNPLLGPSGATTIYGPQKGAQPDLISELEKRLARLVEVSQAQDHAAHPGAGAAGGLGFGLLHFCQATLRPGFDIVADAVQLTERLKICDLVVTGEGSMDAQTLFGKGPAGIARLAQAAGKPCLALAGHISPEVKAAKLFTAHAALSDLDLPLSELMARADELLTKRTRDAFTTEDLKLCHENPKLSTTQKITPINKPK